jgi:hypothetical protein
MALFTAGELISKGQRFVSRVNAGSYRTKDARTILNESALSESASREFDIFLSHSYLDANLVAGLKIDIEEMGYSVYVDWIQDGQLDRTKVDKETANLLRSRMKQCKSLFYATSDNSSSSKWMPWECGYFDGVKGRVAICPIAMQGTQYEYRGQEYLGLYPYIQKAIPDGGTSPTLWVYETSTKYVIYRAWLQGKQPIERTGS